MMSGLSVILFAAALSLFRCTFADVVTGIPDMAPPGYEKWESPVVVPAIPVAGHGDWAGAVAKARSFVAQLTLEEKVNLTTGTGSQDRCVGHTGQVTRIGFPGLCFEDSPLGVRSADFVSVFPAGINAASTWDKNLMFRRGEAMGNENMLKGINFALGPMMNMGRVPAAGRNWEGFGGDPFLAGVAAAQTVQGMQSQRVIATAKHLIANEQEHYRGGSLSRQIYSSNIDDKTMHEVYFWPFGESIAAGVGAIMCSYNKINQTQACQNSKILNGLVKGELNFQGTIMSDWTAMIDDVQPALAGLDMNMPGFMAFGLGPQTFDPVKTNNSFWGSALIEAVKTGKVPESRVDDMVIRTMTAYYKMGQDQKYPAVNFHQLTQATYNSQGEMINEHVNAQGDHYKVIREIAAASIVLLKNKNHTLPLDANKLKRVAIIGSDAGPNPCGPNGCTDRGCDRGNLAMGWGSGTANFPYLVDPLSAIQTFVHSKNPTAVVEGMLDDWDYDQAQMIGSLADTCLVFVNADSGEGYLTVDGNEGDRNNLTTWHGGDTLIQVTAEVCPNTIVVTNFVGPVILEAWIDNPNVTAVVHAGLPGQESGNGLVDVLFGKVNPSGRLPYTIAKQESDYAARLLYTTNETTPQIMYSEGVNIDYRHFDAKNITPRFEFGFGLSYTTFAYNGLDIRPAKAKRDVLTDWSSPVSINMSSSAVGSSTSTLLNNVTSAYAVGNYTSPAVSNSYPATRNATATAASTANATFPAYVPSNVTIPIPIHNNTNTTIPTSMPGTNTNKNATYTAYTPSNVTVAMPICNHNTTYASMPNSTPDVISTNPGGPASLYDIAFAITYAITNIGDVDGHEVSQVYLGFPPEAQEPPRMLRGFDRTFIKQGQTENIQVQLRNKDISYWDVVKQKWVIPKGEITVYVGSSSGKIHLQGTLVAS